MHSGIPGPSGRVGLPTEVEVSRALCQKGDASWPVESWEPLCHLGHPSWLLCHTGVVRRHTRKQLFTVERTANLNAVLRNLGAIWALVRW